MQPLDEPIALGPSNLRRPVLDALELQKQLIRMMVGSPTEFPSIVAEDRRNRRSVLIERGQYIVVDHVHSLFVYNPPLCQDSCRLL